MNSSLLGYVLAFLTTVIWGGAYVIKAVALEYLTPFDIIAYNVILTFIILFFICLFRKNGFKMTKRDLWLAGLSGLLGCVTSQFLTNVGVQYVGSVASSVVYATVPPTCLIIDMLMKRSRFSIVNILAVTASFIGVVMVVISGGLGSFNIIGYSCLLMVNVVWIAYCYIKNKISIHADSLTTLFYQFFFGALFVLPSFFFKTYDFQVLLIPEVGMSVLFFGIINGFFAFWFFNLAISKIGITPANIVSNFMPIITLIINTIMFKTAILPLQIVGVVVVVISVLVALINTAKEIDPTI